MAEKEVLIYWFLECIFTLTPFLFLSFQDTKNQSAAQVHQITDQWTKGIISSEQYFTTLKSIGITKNVIHEI